MSTLSMRELLEAGAHFGHQTRFWNPKMSQYIFGSRNKIHIINLEQTVDRFNEAAKFITDLVSKGGTVLFVGTKRTSRDAVVEEAQRAGMPYVEQRWLGGMMTNFKTIRRSIKHLKDMEQTVADGGLEKMNKKEFLAFNHELAKLNKSMGGIKDMNGRPDALVVIDTGHHKIAVQEANKLGIPVVGVVDTNHDPSDIQYPIPGNDDSARAVRLYLKGFADAVLEGKQRSVEETLKAAGKEEEFVEEVIVEETAPAE